MRHRLIECRKRMGIKPKEVAKKLGVTPRMYYFYESGYRNPTIKNANKLEDMFGLPQRILLEVSDSTTSA